METANTSGIFGINDVAVPSWKSVAQPATHQQLQKYAAWEDYVRNYIRGEELDNDDDNSGYIAQPTLLPSVPNISTVANETAKAAITSNNIDLNDIPGSDGQTIQSIVLNEEQARVHAIIKYHMLKTACLENNDQLLMIVNGCGSMGKSALIEAITNTSRQLGIGSSLAKMAMSGVAATRIGGTTESGDSSAEIETYGINTQTDWAPGIKDITWGGSRGTITVITLDLREPSTLITTDGLVKLTYPSTCVIFKLDNLLFPRIEGLEANEIPITASEATFTLVEEDGTKSMVRRRQFAIMPAYAFTDYKVQGQTIECVLVNLAEPAKNALDPFHAYVALSRSRGRDTIRLFRDSPTRLITTHPSNDLIPEDE
ncbi:hypothetical protein BDN71DRAFT_1509447 [Pleurotus eryngii]|uniref:DNA helicase n=1 Tax=Pleurotus eryngii TaxID=5323 RepID=A0A9P5ZVB3_PLEER|nr:hypothetical protein BDN71DRAFT_1509447 [Pleurotus eryngii]